MRLLSLYGVIAVALLVACLAPGDVLTKPLKKNRGRQPQVGRDEHRGNRHGQGRGRPEPSQDDDSTTGSSISESMDSNSEEGDFSSSEEASVSDEGVAGEGEGNDGQGPGNRTRGRHNGRDNWPIRPRYNPEHSKRTFGVSKIGEDKKKSSMKKAMAYMAKYGYVGDMDDEDDWNTDGVSEKKMKKGIRMMQKFMGLRETGELDEMTMMMMDKPRCGVHDVVSPATGGENGTADGPLPYQHFGQRWDQQEITFRILNYPSTMPSSETRETILRAFRVWSDVTPLTFREVGLSVPEYADFYIKFGTRYHGDDFSFDGRGGVLAHAFLPKTNSGDLEGDVHFDDDELFTYASYEGTNLFQVAAHEIGHSLGLSHSSDPTALMAPFYPGYQPTFYLPYDDLAGIQSLYGSNPNPFPYPYPYPNPDLSQPTNPPTTTTTVAPGNPTTPSNPNPVPTTVSTPDPNPVDPCNPVFDAITVWRSEFFAFTGNKYGRIRNYKILSQDGGSEARYFFQNFPGDIDAIYETPITYKLLMFKGPSYYVYEGLMLESGPNPITDLDPSLPSDLDAVVTWAADRKTYFFKGEQVWRFDELTQRVDSGWPNRIDQVWLGVPNGVTAAWHDEEQYLTYFLSGKDYFRYDDLYAEVDVGYPRDFIADFFGCF